ncbi:MAG: hypothetical protein H6574_18880 [Lewinellaceae bacterium]|nr:hypothetical protein [Lewinellaceae bacterium]
MTNRETLIKQELIKQYQNRLSFEHELINRRLTWLLTSQSILFAALGLVYGSNNPVNLHTLKQAICLLGFFISIMIWIGVTMGIRAKYLVWKDFNKGKDKSDQVPWGVRTPITKTALVPDFFMPPTFAATWLYLFVNLNL